MLRFRVTQRCVASPETFSTAYPGFLRLATLLFDQPVATLYEPLFEFRTTDVVFFPLGAERNVGHRGVDARAASRIERLIVRTLRPTAPIADDVLGVARV